MSFATARRPASPSISRSRAPKGVTPIAIERAFAIEAPPGDIWDALWAELGQGDPANFNVERSNRPELLSLKVNLAGLPVRITYRITQHDSFSEVAAMLEPLSARYSFLQILTLGKLRTHYQLMLAQGLANLKGALEGEPVEDESD